MAAVAVARSRKRNLCPHCSQYTSNSTYYEHKDLFCENGVWRIEDLGETVPRNDDDHQLEGNHFGVCVSYKTCY